MQKVSQYLDEMQHVYEKALGRSPPVLERDALLGFPPGVDPVRFAIEEVEQLKELSKGFGDGAFGAHWMPAANTYLSDKEFVVEMDLAGIPREDIKVVVTGNELVVHGERKRVIRDQDVRPLSEERLWGAFERRFQLPPAARLEDTKARYVEGVLELKTPFDTQGKPPEKQVDIA